MEKVTINGKKYSIDIEKCKEQGLLVEEEKWYPKNWLTYSVLSNKEKFGHDDKYDASRENGYNTSNFCSFKTNDEAEAFNALGKLIQLRNWWWNNLCDGWRPIPNEWYYAIYTNNKELIRSVLLTTNAILAFPTAKIRDKFYETYRDLIEKAKMFL